MPPSYRSAGLCWAHRNSYYFKIRLKSVMGRKHILLVAEYLVVHIPDATIPRTNPDRTTPHSTIPPATQAAERLQSPIIVVLGENRRSLLNWSSFGSGVPRRIQIAFLLTVLNKPLNQDGHRCLPCDFVSQLLLAAGGQHK